MFTERERTERKYTIQDAVNAARARLDGIPMCVDTIKGLDLTKKITLVELNEIADSLVLDSHLWR